MIVKRWMAPLIPSKQQIQKLFEQEGFEHFEEIFAPGEKIPEHRHPFDETRMIVEGRLLYNVAGNKLLLRPGDRILIPSNTRHSKAVHGDKSCLSICAYQAH